MSKSVFLVVRIYYVRIVEKERSEGGGWRVGFEGWSI
jgi:hypothetical protein